MKKILLILMTLAMAAHAQTHHKRMSDSEMKALISAGTWNFDNCRSGKEFTYHPNGILEIEIEGYGKMRCDIKNGELIETDLPEALTPIKLQLKTFPLSFFLPSTSCSSRVSGIRAICSCTVTSRSSLNV
jgi:hypothetical protein